MAPEVFGVIKAHELGKCRTTKAFSVPEPSAVEACEMPLLQAVWQFRGQVVGPGVFPLPAPHFGGARGSKAVCSVWEGLVLAHGTQAGPLS